ncbi:hypothetical protein ABK040_014604 [Willaertia magna]
MKNKKENINCFSYLSKVLKTESQSLFFLRVFNMIEDIGACDRKLFGSIRNDLLHSIDKLDNYLEMKSIKSVLIKPLKLKQDVNFKILQNETISFLSSLLQNSELKYKVLKRWNLIWKDCKLNNFDSILYFNLLNFYWSYNLYSKSSVEQGWIEKNEGDYYNSSKLEMVLKENKFEWNAFKEEFQKSKVDTQIYNVWKSLFSSETYFKEVCQILKEKSSEFSAELFKKELNELVESGFDITRLSKSLCKIREMTNVNLNEIDDKASKRDEKLEKFWERKEFKGQNKRTATVNVLQEYFGTSLCKAEGLSTNKFHQVLHQVRESTKIRSDYSLICKITRTISLLIRYPSLVEILNKMTIENQNIVCGQLSLSILNLNEIYDISLNNIRQMLLTENYMSTIKQKLEKEFYQSNWEDLQVKVTFKGNDVIEKLNTRELKEKIKLYYSYLGIERVENNPKNYKELFIKFKTKEATQQALENGYFSINDIYFNVFPFAVVFNKTFKR